jgi:acetoin utilization deacetylase AcuC-like enzyme
MTTIYVTDPRYVEHDLPGHPEHAGRIRAVWDALETTGLAARMKRAEPEAASDAQILTVHTQDYLDLLKVVSEEMQPVRFDADTYALPVSPEVARLAAGGVIRAVDGVLGGEADNGLAVVRPPGHHAIPERAMGFCLLGNIAIAARHAQAQYGIGRVMIVDYDVHHGNGTQDMFYDDDSVLFVSTHQYPFYPGTGALQETGSGRGAGYTLNIPLSAGHGDANYTRIFAEIIWPAARRFQPELILVSAGFDAHWTDPLALMRLSLTGYAHITGELIRMAEALCDGRIVFVMEGGYDLGALGEGMANVARALLGDDTASDSFGAHNGKEPDVTNLIRQIREIHAL